MELVLCGHIAVQYWICLISFFDIQWIKIAQDRIQYNPCTFVTEPAVPALLLSLCAVRIVLTSQYKSKDKTDAVCINRQGKR